MSVSRIPEGFQTVTPYLVVKSVPSLIQFLEGAFGAELRESTTLPDGSVIHALMRVGTSMVMMGGAMGDEHPVRPTMLYLYVEDMDAWYEGAMKAGAKSVQEPRDEFYGDRTSAIEDPQGNQWWIATHKEDVTPEEIARRAAVARGQ